MNRIFIRRRKRKDSGTAEAPEIESRVSKRRVFRIDRLEKRAILAKQRKWIFVALAVIVVAIAVIVMKLM